MTTSQPHDEYTPAERAARALYQRLLDAWNQRDAGAFAALFAEDGSSVGFDGSTVDGREAIGAHLGQIFGDHQTATYVAQVRRVNALGADVVLLHAVAGMVPPGRATISPAVNAIQTLVARRQGETWCIALLQNTPAQFHGQPELAQQLTEELQRLVRP
jgi:uncharacterized protein (TIGR02246 family)